MEIRIRETGAVVSEHEFRSMQTANLPAFLNAEMIQLLGGDVVLEAPAPAVTRFQSAMRDGVVQDSLGNWVFAWRVQDWSEEQIAAFFDADKAAKLAEANRQCDTRINAITATYPTTEVLTFSKQETEARAFLSDATSATPLIDALSATRGIDKTELASRIIAKSDLFAVHTGMIVGRRQAIEDALSAAESQSEVDAIDPTTGWPA